MLLILSPNYARDWTLFVDILRLILPFKLAMTDTSAVELLRRQYLQLIDPERLKLPPPEVLRSPDVQKQIYESMFDDAAINLGPSLRYRCRVLKRLIRAIEDSIQDPEEDVGFSLHAFHLQFLPKRWIILAMFMRKKCDSRPGAH